MPTLNWIGKDAVGQPLLKQNAPNPFNPRTTIRFDLPAAGTVRLAIYDVAGRLVKVLVEGEIPAGSHEAVWDGRDSAGRGMASGGYFARLQAGGKVETVRMGLVR
jgi:flagellar hook assembly protein FlgD